MDGIDPRLIVRAWRDPKFAASLPERLRERIPASPAGDFSANLDSSSALGVDPQGTLSRECNTLDRTCNTLDRTCNTLDRTCNTLDRTCNTLDRTCNTLDRTCNTLDRTCNTLDGSCTAGAHCKTASIDATMRAGAAMGAHRGDPR